MRYLSVTSGIEAATTAWHPLGWEPVAFSEIEPFPCKVLAHHYPNVPNLGDMTKFKEWPDYDNIDLLVGGTPCQSFSVAGLRKGLDDPRGNLMLTFLAIADRYKPKWIVFENVPGLLSSNGGRDFGTFLGAMEKLGYGFAYRVLDAQFVRTDGHPYAVPQRRRRVFVVGCLGDWGRAAAVLFDSESLRGNPPPRREAGQSATHSTAQRTFPCGGIGSYVSGDVSSPLLKTGADLGNGCETIICRSVSPTITQNYGKQVDSSDTALAYGWNGDVTPKSSKDVAPTMKSGQGGEGYGVCYPIGLDEEQNAVIDGFGTLKARAEGGGFEGSVMQSNMRVRRLTPRECERLQGFPDDYTNIPGASDTTRYKALGNSMAVNVMQLIGERIQYVESLT